jgi:putative RNase toxin 10 of polymorphic toxin system
VPRGPGFSGQLGRVGEPDVFVTDATSVRGMDAAQIAQRLSIPESPTGYRVFEFPSSSVNGIASPINRSAPGFIGGGRTLGGAPEFVIPNGMIPEGATVTEVPGMTVDPFIIEIIP